MALNQARVHEVENGLRINDGDSQGPIFTGGPLSPVGLDFPIGTFYVQNNGTGAVIWRKYAAGVNDWVKAQPMDFYQAVSAAAETSTTSTTTFLNKLTLTTPSLPLGDYRLAWRYNWRTLAANRFLEERVQRNGANIATAIRLNANVAARPSDSSFVNLLAISGVQTFTLDFKVNGSGTTVYMSAAELELWRIA